MALQRSEMANSLDKNMQLTRQQLQQQQMQQIVQQAQPPPPAATRTAVSATTGMTIFNTSEGLVLSVSVCPLPYPTIPYATLPHPALSYLVLSYFPHITFLFPIENVILLKRLYILTLDFQSTHLIVPYTP